MLRIVNLIVQVGFVAVLTISCRTTSSQLNERNAPRIFLWEIQERETGDVKGWLLGSIHIGPANQVRTFDKAILETYAQSTDLALEVDAESQEAQLDTIRTIGVKGIYKGQDSLRNHLSKEDFDLYVAAVPPEMRLMAAKFKPWFANLIISQSLFEKSKFSPDNGVDHLFMKHSRGQIPIHSLESVSEQFEALADGSDAMHLTSLIASLHLKDVTTEQMEQLHEAYERGDDGLVRTLQRAIATTPDAKKYLNTMLNRRNQTMSNKLVKLYQSNDKTFAIVGTAHLVGDENILDYLQTQGYVTRRVPPSGIRAPLRSKKEDTREIDEAAVP